MKTAISTDAVMQKVFVIIVLLNIFSPAAVNAQICNDPSNVLFGMTGTADIHYIDISSGAVGARINPLNTGTAPNLSNAMGFNQVNGKVYYFKRNIQSNPQAFVVFDPLLNKVTQLANCPGTGLINLGCCTADGAGYYCIDAFGNLFYYRISNNSWTTISSNLRTQSNVTLPYIISAGAMPTATSRIYGDIAIDGSGNMWILISGPNDFGLYKLSAPLPTTAITGVVTIFEQLPATTPTPGLQSIGGVAFNLTGEMFVSTNAGNNKLYRLEKNLTLTYLSTMTMDGIGTDLASCNYPMFVLPVTWERFDATLKGSGKIALTWSGVEGVGTKQYLLQHSMDGVRWHDLTIIQAAGGDTRNYIYEHTNIAEGKHFYRVGRMDLNNRTAFSETKVIYTYGNISFALWPNPTREVLQIETSGYGPAIGVVVADQTGRIILIKELAKGINNLDVRKLHPGNYLVTLQFANGERRSQKFLKK